MSDQRDQRRGPPQAGRGPQEAPPRPAMRSVDPADYGMPSEPVTDLASVSNALQAALSAQCNVLAPITQISFIPPQYAISVRMVVFDATFNAAQVDAKTNGTYYLTDDGKLALHRTALDQLAGAAGLSWVAEKSGRRDDGREVFLWRYQQTGRYRFFDGTEREISREFELDLRDGSPAAEKAGRGLRNARIYGASLCETKAANRVVRAALGLRAYTREEAARPFVFPALVWNPPVGDPMIDRMIAARALGYGMEVFGPIEGNGSSPMLAEPGRVVEGQATEIVPPRAAPRPAQRALPEHPPVPDFAEEGRRLRERAPVLREEAAADVPPWERKTAPAAAPAWTAAAAWKGPYRWADVQDFLHAKNWEEPTSQASLATLAAYLGGDGKAEIDAFMRAGS